MMKHSGILICCLIWGCVARAAPSLDHILTTSDNSCGIHYLTDKNTNGWYLETHVDSCVDGWFDGHREITIRDAFGKPVEQVYGYFNQGYWTGDYPVSFPVVETSMPEDGVSALTLDLGNDARFEAIRFLGQMRSTRMADGTYSAFEACGPARILAVTDQKQLFEEETAQQDLLNTAIHKAQELCPPVKQIYFFASDTDTPTDDAVFFFADVDLVQKQIKVRRLPSSPRRSERVLPSLPIRSEPTGTPLMRVTPIRPTSSVDGVEPETPAPVAQPMMKEPEPAPVPVSETPPVLEPADEPAVVAEPSPVSEPEPVSEPVPDVVSASAPVVTDAVPHLLTASRLLQKPVDGVAAVHVFRVDLSGQAWIDAPVPMKANGRLLPTGWNVVTGRFMALSPDTRAKGAILPRGSIQILSVTPCSEMGCRVSEEAL